MDLDGFYKTYLTVKDLIPMKYEDFLAKNLVTPPLMDFADTDRIFKHNERE